MTHPLDIRDPTFVDDLLRSQEAVHRVATYLRRSGYAVTVPDIVVRPTAAERADYGDDGDLYATARIEVKHRPDLAFRSLADFPYETVLVDVAHTFERADPKPYVYYIVNADFSGMIRILCSARDKWIKRPRPDKNRGGEARVYYECPLALCQYIELPQP